MPHDEVSALQNTVSRRSCVRWRTKRSDSIGSPRCSSPPPLQHTTSPLGRILRQRLETGLPLTRTWEQAIVAPM